MDLPFCKICGERHRLGSCPLWEQPPEPKKKPHAKENHQPAGRPAEEEGPGAAAEDPRREVQIKARQLSPEDMKQESMPVTKPRFDRNAYQRDLMRKRAAAKKEKNG